MLQKWDDVSTIKNQTGLEHYLSVMWDLGSVCASGGELIIAQALFDLKY